MTKKQIEKARKALLVILNELKSHETRYPYPAVAGPPIRFMAYDHCLWMIVKSGEYIEEGRLDKAMRWLGFVQGVLWSCGYVSIDTLKEMNRDANTSK